MKEFLTSSVYFGVFISILGFQIGLYCKKKFKASIFNPVLISTAFVMLFLLLSNIRYETYYAGAQHLTYLLTPATVCLAIPLYKQLPLLKKNAPSILTGIFSGVAVNFLCIFLLSKWMGFSNQLYVTLLPKSITTAIGIALAEEFGGIPTITIVAIIVTGVFGNIAAESILRILRVTNPIARGLAIGTSSHVLGTARALDLGEVEGATSSLAIVVTGLMTVALFPLAAPLI